MTDTDTTTTLYTAEEVAEHTTHDDLWVIINGKVYNISSYIDEHPGGEEVILDCAGTDATEAFDDIGHSDEAHEILEKLYLGNLKGAKIVQAKHAQASKSDEDSGINFPLIAVGIFLAAFGVNYYKSNFA